MSNNKQLRLMLARIQSLNDLNATLQKDNDNLKTEVARLRGEVVNAYEECVEIAWNRKNKTALDVHKALDITWRTKQALNHKEK